MGFPHFPRTVICSDIPSSEQAALDRGLLVASIKCLSDRLSRGDPIWFTPQEIETVRRYIPGALDGEESNPLFNAFYVGIAAGIAHTFIAKKKPAVRHRELPRKIRQVDMDDEDT
jgi:hypothetical protein